MSEFSPRQSIENIFRHWYLMPLLSLLGAAVGWGINQFKPPLYEAKAIFTVNINYNQPDILDKIDNDHYAEDQMVVAVMSGMQSSDVLNKVVEEATFLGVSPSDLVIGKRLTVERKTSEVELIVRYKDPEIAARLANSWAEHSLEYLKEGQVHALRTYELNQLIKNLAACIQLGPNNPEGLCTNMDLQAFNARLQEAQTELVTETQASRGLIPAILFDFSRQADLPNTPVVYQSQVLVLAGALIGLFSSLALGREKKLRTTAASATTL
jgi:uncharacterized protein involved in exopolysaccharide biosynthesis